LHREKQAWPQPWATE